MASRSTRSSPKGTTPTPAQRALEIAVETKRHPYVKDKSPNALATRVARRLNSEGFRPESGKAFFTGAQVLEAFLEGQEQELTEQALGRKSA